MKYFVLIISFLVCVCSSDYLVTSIAGSCMLVSFLLILSQIWNAIKSSTQDTPPMVILSDPKTNQVTLKKKLVKTPIVPKIASNSKSAYGSNAQNSYYLEDGDIKTIPIKPSSSTKRK